MPFVMKEQAGNPTPVANKGTLYVKDSSGVTQLYYQADDGTISLMTGPGSGVTTLGAIGASPNANAATISGVTLNLEPASASFGGVVTTAAQTFGGDKTFSGKVTIPASSGSELTLNGQVYTFPAALGAAGSQLTDALGSGVLSWAAAAGAGVSQAQALKFTSYRG